MLDHKTKQISLTIVIPFDFNLETNQELTKTIYHTPEYCCSSLLFFEKSLNLVLLLKYRSCVLVSVSSTFQVISYAKNT